MDTLPSIPTACLDAIPAGASVEIYTDGACLGNPGPAASAFAIIYEGKVIHSAARFLGHATNNIAELTAALDGLRFLADRSADLRVTLLADSNQVIQGMSVWLGNWKARGWRRADGKPVANRQHYKSLTRLLRPSRRSTGSTSKATPETSSTSLWTGLPMARLRRVGRGRLKRRRVDGAGACSASLDLKSELGAERWGQFVFPPLGRPGQAPENARQSEVSEKAKRSWLGNLDSHMISTT